MTDDEFDAIYEESKCDGSRDKIIAYLFDERKKLLAYQDYIERHADPDTVKAARLEADFASPAVVACPKCGQLLAGHQFVFCSECGHGTPQ